MTRFAEVAVNSPAAGRRTFSYEIPSGMGVEPGQPVLVPFGSRLLQGIVLELTLYPPPEAADKTKPIAQALAPSAMLFPHQLELSRWLSHHYLCPLFPCLGSMLPPGFERRLLTFFSPTSNPSPSALASLTPKQREIWHLLEKQSQVELNQVRKLLGREVEGLLAQMVRRGLAVKAQELEPVRVHQKMVPYLCLEVAPEEASQEAARLRGRRAHQQAKLLELLAQMPTPIPLAEVRKLAPISHAALSSLQHKGLLSLENIPVLRDPLAQHRAALTQPPTLTPQQEAAWGAIREGLLQARPGKAPAFLLHGVTGSGKTELYLRALALAEEMGKQGIVLVPEIALTPQTIDRFASRFPGQVAVLHSRLSLGEQFDSWHRIREGHFQVVVGSRGAIFAPHPNLGLVVVDEEHEGAYKQEQPPPYHAREVALKLGQLCGAVVILGSATPDVETYYRAERGELIRLELPQRIGSPQEGGSGLPQVEVVDLRQELRLGNRSLFSRPLSAALSQTLAAGEQAILFLNRRGSASFVQCRGCGHVMKCRRCAIALTYHAPEDSLVCHQCNYRIAPPTTCPQCLRPGLRYLGLGTEKVEAEARQAFPQARLLRWDRDVTRGKGSHERILAQFQSREADILVGTQMVAKGLDLPEVTLVGVISADVSLHLPHFRAEERAFQLLTQVAGRAGRGPEEGRVIIQTYSPEHPAVVAAAHQDYSSFYRREIEERRRLGYPPFSRLIRLVYANLSAHRSQQEAERLCQRLRQEREGKGLSQPDVLGPTPAYIARLRGRYRWQILLRGPEPRLLLEDMPLPRGWSVDVDPLDLL
ncbi:MAG: primosomal protein N' [Chloroflexi bacterium]|nr:primosomal protein N' [Chloroflexota bacterium]